MHDMITRDLEFSEKRTTFKLPNLRSLKNMSHKFIFEINSVSYIQV